MRAMIKKNRLRGNYALPALSLLLLLILTLTSAWTNNQPSSSDYAPPKIFRPKVIRSTMEKVTAWQLKNPKHAPTDWTNGAFYAGVVAAYKTTKSKKILDSLMAHGNRTGWQPGRRYDHADDIAISQTYIDLYRVKNDRNMLKPTIDTVAKLRTVPGREVARNGITWWWCDALFMGPPTLAKLGVSLNDPSY